MGSFQIFNFIMKNLKLIGLIFWGLVCFSQSKAVPKSDICPADLLQQCVNEISEVAKECQDLTNLASCIEDALGTASRCLPCLCDILALIPGVDISDCPTK